MTPKSNRTKAEPLLREGLEHRPALHDQGISASYLGMVKFRAGGRSEARRLIKRGHGAARRTPAADES